MNKTNKPPPADRQRAVLLLLEETLGLGPVATAKRLTVPYGTYKDWKSGRRTMPSIAIEYSKLLMFMKSGDWSIGAEL